MRSHAAEGSDSATVEEVEQAVAELSEADLLRLGKYAAWRARGLQAIGLGWSAEDLMQEALARTIGAARKWKRGVPFVKHLIGAIRSIASHAADPLAGNRPTGIDSDGVADDVCHATLVSQRSDPEDLVGATETLTAIRQRFSDDHEVDLLLTGICDGMTGAEIRQACGWSQQELETITRRMRRILEREEVWRS